MGKLLFGDIISSGQVIKSLSISSELAKLACSHLEWLLSKGYSEFTIKGRGFDMGDFISWADMRDITNPGQVTRQVLERYRKHLYHYRKADGQPLNVKTQCLRLIALRVFFKWLVRNNHIHYNPASELELPRIGRSLPKHVFNLREIESVLGVVDISNPFGIRDRAMLETLFCTGIRRIELGNLKLSDPDFEEGTLRVSKGKNKKDRLVPLGDRAMCWVIKYIEESRPELVKDNENDEDENVLFLSRHGTPIKVNYLGTLVTNYVKKAGIEKGGGCHAFRHSMATLMLEGGADIRYIQEMLGHESLETTQVYTQVSINKLKEIHKKTHPGAMLRDGKKRH